MSYEMLLKETDLLSYEERINLMEYLVNSLKINNEKNTVTLQTQEKIDALNSIFGILSQEEASAVEMSIKDGVKFREIM